jgi:hypothetical protein
LCWSRRLVAAIAIVGFLLVSKLGFADHTITDPRAYCDRVAELIAAEDFDNLTADLLAHSNGAGILADMKAGLSSLPAFWSKAGSLRSSEHVSEKKLGEAYVRHWYIFVYDLGPMFVRCTMYRPGNAWLFIDMEFNDKPEKIGLTH